MMGRWVVHLMSVSATRGLRVAMVPVRMVMAVTVTLSSRGVRVLEFALQLLDALAVVPHDIPYVGDAVEVDLELVDLAHYVLEARNLSIGIVHQVAGTVILLHCHDRALLAEILDAGLDLLHEPVKVARQGGEARAVQEQSTL